MAEKSPPDPAGPPSRAEFAELVAYTLEVSGFLALALERLSHHDRSAAGEIADHVRECAAQLADRLGFDFHA